MSDIRKRLEKLEAARAPLRAPLTAEEQEREARMRAHLETVPGGPELLAEMDAAKPDWHGFAGALVSFWGPKAPEAYVWIAPNGGGSTWAPS